MRAERAVRTRAQLVSVGHDLFLAQGWTPTTMTQVAAAAGVARPTVYLHFETKLALLIACIDASLSAIPVRDRPDYQAMGSGTRAGRAATAGRWLRKAHQRSALVQRVLDQAAYSTPEAALTRTRMERRRHDEFSHACRLVLAGGSLGPLVDEPHIDGTLVDELWTLGSRDVWFMLADRGWSPQQWEAWFVRVLLQALDGHGV